MFPPGRLPNFFIVGAPKAGSTSLYHYLDQHPQVFMSPVKEPCYFASEIRPENFASEYARQVKRDLAGLQLYLSGPMMEKRPGGLVTDWHQYLSLFAAANSETALGEASVCYLWSATAAANIRSRIPHARIIMILRHPAERAFSQWMHGLSAGWIRRPFREHIEAGLRNHGAKFGTEFPFLELGLYYSQVKRYLDTFPPEQVRIGLYGEEDQYSRVLEFLGVQASFQPDMSRRHLEVRVPRNLNAGHYLKSTGIWQRARDMCPPALLPLARRLVQRPRRTIRMEARDRAFLCGYYREDVLRLADLLNRDLSDWLA